jgi:hypothetical protein
MKPAKHQPTFLTTATSPALQKTVVVALVISAERWRASAKGRRMRTPTAVGHRAALAAARAFREPVDAAHYGRYEKGKIHKAPQFRRDHTWSVIVAHAEPTRAGCKRSSWLCGGKGSRYSAAAGFQAPTSAAILSNRECKIRTRKKKHKPVPVPKNSPVVPISSQYFQMSISRFIFNNNHRCRYRYRYMYRYMYKHWLLSYLD